jgi:hypothetical protein
MDASAVLPDADPDAPDPVEPDPDPVAPDDPEAVDPDDPEAVAPDDPEVVEPDDPEVVEPDNPEVDPLPVPLLCSGELLPQAASRPIAPTANRGESGRTREEINLTMKHLDLYEVPPEQARPRASCH